LHHDEAGGRKPGMLVHTPQGILHGPDEVARAAFQKRARAGDAAHDPESASTRTGRWCRPRCTSD
jgi:hypothetical protein